MYKRKIRKLLFACSFCLMLTGTVGCSKGSNSVNVNHEMEAEFNQNGDYTGLNDVNDKISLEEAVNAGYYVRNELEGTFPGSKQSSSFTVLTDDKELSFNDVARALISSNMDEINKISSFEIVM